MPKLTSIDRKSAIAFQQAAGLALKALAEEYGLKLAPSSARYSNSDITLKMKFSVADPQVVSQKQSDEFAEYAPLYGLTANDMGRSAHVSGKVMKLVGFRPNRPKFPIVLEDMSGKSMLYTRSVLVHFGVKAPFLPSLMD